MEVSNSVVNPGEDPSNSMIPSVILPSSPFFLGPQDKPGDFITPIKLKLDNFDEWSHAIRVSLLSRRKFGFLDGSIIDFGPPVSREDWIAVQCMLVAWLMNTISPEVRNLLSNYDNARTLWVDLHERFSIINGPRIQQLKAEINRCEQHKSMTISTYFSKLKVLWDELDRHEPLYTCQCDGCSCDLGRKYAIRREHDRLHQFLLGLNSDLYAHIRSHLLAQDPLPSLNRAFQVVVQEERVRGIGLAKSENVDNVAFAVRGIVPSGSTARSGAVRGDRTLSRSVCVHCGKRGHDASTCFLIHGTPEWYREKYGKKPASMSVHRPQPQQTRTRAMAISHASQNASTASDFGTLLQSVASQSTAPAGYTAPAGSSHMAVPDGFTTTQWTAILAACGKHSVAHTNSLPFHSTQGPAYEGGDWDG